jgi:hypothetical protein
MQLGAAHAGGEYPCSSRTSAIVSTTGLARLRRRSKLCPASKVHLALSRVKDPEEVYRKGTPLERRVMNRAIFERIEVGPDAEITGTALTPVYGGAVGLAAGPWPPLGPVGRPDQRRAGYAVFSTCDRPCPLNRSARKPQARRLGRSAGSRFGC